MSDHTKFLGLYIDKYLTYEYHINHICKKISKTLGVINKVKHILDRKTLRQLYYSLVYPYLLYCNIEWCLNYKTRINRLIILQKKR
jgi:hypothetical protein